MINIVYRISKAGYNKIKATYINNQNCFENAIKCFNPSKNKWFVIADGVDEPIVKLLEDNLPKECVDYVEIKNGPGYPFMYMLNKMIQTLPDDEIVYFLENDYVHREGSDLAIEEAIELGADYVTLYDHPDKYLNPDEGGNPYIDGRSEVTRVFLTDSCHWKLTNSTTGTFAATIKVLKRDYETIKKYANNQHWSDFNMFTDLLNQGATLVSPIPSYSTHGDLQTISPLINWENEL
jgi:hypothetical protein